MATLPDADYQAVDQQLAQANRILLLTHGRPDGDAVGSTIALYRALVARGKQVSMICSDPLPEKYHYLEDATLVAQDFPTMGSVIKVPTEEIEIDKVSYNMQNGTLNLVITPVSGKLNHDHVRLTYADPEIDLIVTLDTPELRLLGQFYAEHQTLFEKMPVLNIDHHVSNEQFGTLQLVDGSAPSTGEVLFQYFKATGQTIDPAMATALLTAIVTDTGSFQHMATTSDSFAIASELMEQGGKLQDVVENMYRRKSLSMLKLWGRVLTSLKQDQGHRMVWAVVTEEDFKQTGAREEQASEALNELIVGVPDVDVALLLYQYPGHAVRGSLRTSAQFNASDLAAMFGGGGHPPAAGFTLDDVPMAEARQSVVAQLKQAIESGQGAQKPSALRPEDVVSRIGEMMQADSQPAEA